MGGRQDEIPDDLAGPAQGWERCAVEPERHAAGIAHRHPKPHLRPEARRLPRLQEDLAPLSRVGPNRQPGRLVGADNQHVARRGCLSTTSVPIRVGASAAESPTEETDGVTLPKSRSEIPTASSPTGCDSSVCGAAVGAWASRSCARFDAKESAMKTRGVTTRMATMVQSICFHGIIGAERVADGGASEGRGGRRTACRNSASMAAASS